jgi:hypothetical protein
MLRGRIRIESIALLAIAAALGAAPSPARADDVELQLMSEPTSFTDVIDAFDDRDPFDVNITIGFLRTWEFGRVQRERNDPEAATGRMSQHWHDVADWNHEVNQLLLGLDVGIFRDLAIYSRLPVILSDDRTLTAVSGLDPIDLSDRVDRMPYFSLDAPFRSPTRSGVDYLAAGLAWSILNQHRDRNVPTWVVMVEGRFNLGEPMHACNPSGECLGSQVFRDPMDPNNPMNGRVVRAGDPGVGRGTNGLRLEMRSSYRYEFIEPYAGLAFQIEWPGSGDRYFLPSGSLAGFINQRPPILGRLTVGLAVIPWEDRQHWQRFSVDLRFTGDYISEGRDYSPLFDALGSSTHPALAYPTLEGQPDMVRGTEGLRAVSFYGLTDTELHARLGFHVLVEVQAARYVRFGVSGSVYHSTPYIITFADACNPNVDAPPGGDERLVGTCRSGIINPHHRPTIDLPGQRFRMEGVTQVDLAITATAQF